MLTRRSRNSSRLTRSWARFVLSSEQVSLMLPSPINDVGTAAPAWEEWLRARFPGYLLHEADGEPRDAAAIQRALELLTGNPGALQRLAALGFLLDPTRGAYAWAT